MFCDVLTFSIICNMDFLANGNLDIAFCSVADIRCTKFGFYKIQIFFLFTSLQLITYLQPILRPKRAQVKKVVIDFVSEFCDQKRAQVTNFATNFVIDQNLRLILRPI